MSWQLQVVSKLEMHAMINFLWVKWYNCIEIDRQLPEVHGESAMSHQAIPKQNNMFQNGHTDMNDAEYKRRPSTATNFVIAAHVKEYIIENRCIPTNKMYKLDISHGSVYKIIVDSLNFIKFVLDGCLIY